MNYKDCWFKGHCKAENTDCKENCLKYVLVKSLYTLSRLPEYRWKKAELTADYDKDYKVFAQLAEIEKNIVSFVEDGNFCIIHSSNCGNGKTSWAVRLMQAYFNKIWHKSNFEQKGLFVHIPTFLVDCKREINRPTDEFDVLCKQIQDVDLVIFDDIYYAYTEYETQLLNKFVDVRANNRKATIFTANGNMQKFKDTMDNRLASRIFSGFDFELVETDKRGLYND